MFNKAEKVNNIVLTDDKPIDLHHEIYLAQAQDPLILKFNMTKEGEQIPIRWFLINNLWCYQQRIYIPSPLQQTLF